MEKFTKLNYAEIETKKISDDETSFTLKPLSRGFANTIGNAIRRVLLSSVSGVAPFAIKIKGVQHEFQTINGVVEDVVQLILKLNKIKYIYNKEVFEDDKVIKVSLKDKNKIVKASDLILPIGVEVVDRDLEIATVSKPGSLELEIFLKTGKGYNTFTENKEIIKKLSSSIESNLESGSLIAIDSDFSPIDRVSYESIDLNSETSEIEEKLKINIKTNGSIKAKNAIAEASHILLSHLQKLADVSNIEYSEIFYDSKDKDKNKNVEKVQISTIDLSVRSYNCLRRQGYTTIDELASLTMDELINIKNLGKKSVDEIVDKLLQYGITIERGEHG